MTPLVQSPRVFSFVREHSSDPDQHNGDPRGWALFYRLSVIEIRFPSMAERKEDFPLLLRHFLENIFRSL
jgi:transcriptional regulator with AAA-type ATPase domain